MVSTFGTPTPSSWPRAVVLLDARTGVPPSWAVCIRVTAHRPARFGCRASGYSAVVQRTFDTLTDTLIFVSWVFYAAGAYGVFVLRRREPEAPRPYRVPGYPLVPWGFIIFSALYLGFTIYNDLVAYRAAVAAGQPALINSAFGMALVLIGTPVYWFYRRRRPPPS